MIGCECEVCTSTNRKDNRLRSSIIVRSANTTIVVDAGPDFRYQMLRDKVKHLDAILFTHPHKDHLAGLDDVRAFNFWSKKQMEVYANEMTQEVIIREFPYAFSDSKYPGLPEIHLNTIDETAFDVNELHIQPILTWHLKMPVYAFRFGKFSYVTDANRIDEADRQKLRGSEVIVLNALRKEKHISHFNLEEAIAVVKDLQIPRAYFTHISHQLGLHDVINRELPAGMQLAYDGLSFDL